MPLMRYRVPAIQSLMPSIDPRNADQNFVLDGRNFLFDSKGPKSGFTGRYLCPFPFAQSADIQGKRIEGRTFVFTPEGIFVWRDSVPFMWDPLYVFTSPLAAADRAPWSVIYMSNQYFMAHPSRGFYVANVSAGVQRVWINRKLDSDIPGLPGGIRGMDVVRGRAIMVTNDSITWSRVGDLSDLNPGIGGAGQQAISQIVKGDFVALTSFQDGFVVWTTEGSILAEFIGGDNVWRFTAYTSTERPFGPWTTINLIGGGSAFMSRRGLQIVGPTDVPKDWTPEFNEYLRDYLDDKAENARKWRLAYDESTQTIYLSESANLDTYWRTFVLKPTLNKWGVFSDTVYGFLPLTETQFGYVDVNGFPFYLDDKLFNRGTVEPDIARGLDRHFPRLEKQQAVLSSSAVSRTLNVDSTHPVTMANSPSAGWYDPRVMDVPQEPGLRGMDSWIEIGYLRPAESPAADGMTEIQLVSLGSVPSGPPAEESFVTDWKPDYFYPNLIDLNVMPDSIIYEDIVEDLNGESGLDDLLADAAADNEDFNDMVQAIYDFGPVNLVDLNLATTYLDLNDYASSLTEIDYGIVLKSSQDGITFDETVPELAKFNTSSREWAVCAENVYHRLRLSANDVNQYFHAQKLELEVNITGRIG